MKIFFPIRAGRISVDQDFLLLTTALLWCLYMYTGNTTLCNCNFEKIKICVHQQPEVTSLNVLVHSNNSPELKYINLNVKLDEAKQQNVIFERLNQGFLALFYDWLKLVWAIGGLIWVCSYRKDKFTIVLSDGSALLNRLVTPLKSLTCVCVLCGRPGLSPRKLDQQNQQDARQQQLEAAEGRHCVLTHQLTVTSRLGTHCRERQWN